MKGDCCMAKAKDCVARIFVGTWLLVTLSACETSKHAEIMSTEDLPIQTQISTETKQVPVTESDQDGVPLGRQSISQESLALIPESPPSPEFPAGGEAEMPGVELDSEAITVAPSARQMPVLPEELLEFPRGSRSPASDYVPEPPPQAFPDKGVKEFVETDVPVQEPGGDSMTQLSPSEFVPEVPAQARDGEAQGAQARDGEAQGGASLNRVKDSGLADVFFDFDQYAIRSDAVAVLEKNAELLKNTYENSSVLIEGHCDERGTADYNLELGKRRAQAVKDYLIDLGVQETRIQIVSYGKEKPFCTESGPSCWQRNRRGHFVSQ